MWQTDITQRHRPHYAQHRAGKKEDKTFSKSHQHFQQWLTKWMQSTGHQKVFWFIPFLWCRFFFDFRFLQMHQLRQIWSRYDRWTRPTTFTVDFLSKMACSSRSSVVRRWTATQQTWVQVPLSPIWVIFKKGSHAPGTFRFTRGDAQALKVKVVDLYSAST